MRAIRIAVLGLMVGMIASAGVIKVATFPVRHPKKTVKAIYRVGSYPVRHPVKTVF